MKNISLHIPPLNKVINRLFNRFHMTIFIVFVVVGLSVAVLLLNTMISETSTSDGYVSPIGAGTIDEATLERIRSLHTSDQTPPPLELPPGRINPFVE